MLRVHGASREVGLSSRAAVVTAVQRLRRGLAEQVDLERRIDRHEPLLDADDLLPVDWVNDPRIIGIEQRFVSINATLEVDLLGQAASETLNGRYYSGSGGQADFARGAMYSEHGQGFIVLHSTARDGNISRISPQLPAGSVVTTLKNTVDNVVTEYGVAELRGRPVRERAR